MPVPVLTRVQALEQREDALLVGRINADAMVAYRDVPVPTLGFGQRAVHAKSCTRDCRRVHASGGPA